MLSPLTVSRAGMSTSVAAMHVAAHNIANTSVEGFRRQRAEPQTTADGGVTASFGPAGDGGDRIEADLVGLLQAKNGFLANLAVFRRADEAFASLIDELA